MRYAIALSLLALGLGWQVPSAAQDQYDWLTTILPYLDSPVATAIYRQNCPNNYVPLYRTDPNTHPNEVRIQPRLIDSAGAPLDPTLGRSNYAGAGYIIETRNGRNEFHGNTLALACMKLDRLAQGTPIQRTLPPGGQTTFLPPLSCPSGGVPVGFVTNADGDTIQERARVFIVNQAAMTNLLDGTYGAYTSLGLGFLNTTTSPLELRGQVFCANLPGAQTIVTSADVVANTPYEVFGSIPDGFDLVTYSFAVNNAVENNVGFWDESGQVSSELPYARPPPSAIPGYKLLRAILDGKGNPPTTSMSKQQVVGRAFIGSLVVPSTTPVPPPSIVTIVEFYHAGLDHYFITAIPKEISDLDSGVHRGWQRTGETFNAYGISSSGRTGRRPVCRAYGNPAAGLDSHFYSASPRECVATLRDFGDDWLYEAGEVFQMEIPDTTTGACAADRVPIHRLWNGRADSSHRYVKTLALRAQMIARGFVSEGYGPNGVVFCALP